MADENTEAGIPSAFVENANAGVGQDAGVIPEPTFDYNQYQMETTGKAMTRIFQAIGDNASLLSYSAGSTAESIKENLNVVADIVRGILVECKVPSHDFQNLSDTFQNTLILMFDIIARQKKEFEKELLARVIDSRDPGNPEMCSPEYETLGDLFLALKKKQDEQGIEHYYTVKKEPQAV